MGSTASKEVVKPPKTIMQQAEDIIVPNISVSIAGDPKSGKTYLGCTFPEPIKLMSFDIGAKWITHQPVFVSKKIDMTEFPLPTIDTYTPNKEQYWAEDLWLRIKKESYEAIDSGKYKTLVLDPIAFLWEIVRSACAEEQNRDKLGKARDYGEANIRMRSLFNRAIVSGLNLVATSYLKEVWENDKPTGEVKLDGWKHVESLADVCLNVKYHNKKFITVMKVNRFDPTLNGKEFEDFNYSDLIALLGV